MNLKKKSVEIRNSEHTTEKSALQRGADFLKIFMLGPKNIFLGILINCLNFKGFDINDAIAVLRLDDLYVESFEIKDGYIGII